MTSKHEEFEQKLHKYYSSARERDRLSATSLGGLVELLAMRQALGTIPKDSTILDVGGGTGVQSAWLAEQGHLVTMIDPVPAHVEVARGYGTFSAKIGDARELAFTDSTFDAVLLLGPLYHLPSLTQRAQALSECARILRPGGLLFAAGLSRVASFINALLFTDGECVTNETLNLLKTGEWINSGEGFPGGHFHTAQELQEEISTAGFSHVKVIGLELGLHYEFMAPDFGLAWQVTGFNNDINRALTPQASAAAAMLSPHLLAMATIC
ncbi:class I SAM-dependent methyltransferase [Trueperella pyogenes]|uniref:class I SAM-dependent methyltransferase n=1 Tax=Trueperella pyogenes TaxID=1661 RepID=UPI00345DDB2F